MARKFLFTAADIAELPKPNEISTNAIVMLLRTANRKQVRDIAEVLVKANDPGTAWLEAVVLKALEAS